MKNKTINVFGWLVYSLKLIEKYTSFFLAYSITTVILLSFVHQFDIPFWNFIIIIVTPFICASIFDIFEKYQN